MITIKKKLTRLFSSIQHVEKKIFSTMSCSIDISICKNFLDMEDLIPAYSKLSVTGEDEVSVQSFDRSKIITIYMVYMHA